MVLTDSQIERYSRQIIVPGVGGNAQERLLASCVAIVAEPADAAGALAYLAGAGVGRIVVHPVGDRAPYDAMVERTRDLNPEVAVSFASDATADSYDLMFALIGGARAAEATQRLWRVPGADAPGTRQRRCGTVILARLDAPGVIALMLALPPCPLCAEADLLSPPGARASNAGAVAMVAVTEAFKLLAGFSGQQLEGRLIEFEGYVSRPRALGRRRISGGGQVRCACEALS